MLFSIFVGDMGSGIKCSFSKTDYNSKLCGVVVTMEGRDSSQKDPER